MNTKDFKIIYTSGWGEIDDFETPLKGHRNDVVVILKEDKRFKVDFISVDRLKMELDLEEKSGGMPIYAEPGLIVLQGVTKELIEKAIEKVYKEGFFNSLNPMKTA